MSHQQSKQAKAANVQLSKTLSYLLRHGAVKEGLIMRSDGFVLLADVLANPTMKTAKKDVCREDLERIVLLDAKGRYKLQEIDGNLYIRANQGHSVDIVTSDIFAGLITDPTITAIHGTFAKFLDSILATGLSSMSRTHIHLAAGLRADVASGYRSDCNVLIHIDVLLSMADGIQFYRSENGVILTDGIDGILAPKYFKKIERI